MGNGLEFDSIVFAGGGSRCMWQAGFWNVLQGELKKKPSVVAGVSAGATISCMCMADLAHEGIGFFKKISGENKKNFYFSRIFSKKPAFPQYDMYRETILQVVDDAAFESLKNGPEIRVLIARPPKWLGPRSGTVFGLMAYALEKKIKYPVHPTWTSKIGYAPEVAYVSECKATSDLADLLLQSSCTPPFVPIMRRNGETVLDGGLVDNVPVCALDERPGKTLVLLSRTYPENRIPKVDDRIYIQPTQAPPIYQWDYTNPKGIQTAFDMGERDAEKFLKAQK